MWKHLLYKSSLHIFRQTHVSFTSSVTPGRNRQLWMSHVTHMNESCHKYEWVMSHIYNRVVYTWMKHNLRHRTTWKGRVMAHTKLSHAPHVNESCRTNEWCAYTNDRHWCHHRQVHTHAHTHTRTHTHVCIYIYLLPESELGQKTPFSGAGSPRTTPVVTVPVAEEVNVPETGATSPAMT